MTNGVSAHALSETIGLIYDCALDPECWREAVRAMAEVVDSPLGSINIQDLTNPTVICLYDYGYPPEFWMRYQEFVEESPITPLLSRTKIGGVLTLQMICDDDTLFDSRYYNELLRPFGFLDFIGMLGLRSSGRIAGVHACRFETQPRYGEREVKLFRLLSPHVCRSLTISDALDLRTLKSDMLEATLNELSAGVFLLNREGQVLYMNAAAEQQIGSGTALRLVGNKLEAVDPTARTELRQAIKEGSADGYHSPIGPHSLATPGSDGRGYVATLMPLEGGRRSSVMAPFTANVAVFVQDPHHATFAAGEAFANLYGLTAAELRVVLALSQGLSAKDAATMLGIGEPTVRTHLQHAFSKTGTAKQSQLLHLLHSATPPAAAN